LDRLYYATITDGTDGEETYGTPAQLAKAIQADLSVEVAEAVLYADDAAQEIVKEFNNGTLTLNVDDLAPASLSALTGAVVDSNGVIESTTEDSGGYVAIGFRARRSNGSYIYYWLYRVKFSIPAATLQTKADSITFQTPTIEGTIMRRNKPDSAGKHPWKVEAREGDTGVTQSVIDGWYATVYEPTFSSNEN
jgi:phi13 family phage major tail protein